MTATPFDNHEPGQPYELTRKQFLAFAGFPQTLQGPELWAAIAAREASRTFNPLAELCPSALCCDTDTDSMSMWWSYETTSGTALFIEEHRTFLTRQSPGYPGKECSGDLPPPVYKVTIPAERDVPGRRHYEALRNGQSFGNC